ncbi:MAG TPA: FAD binding domain-containing protein [Acidimicrobiia bacterium]|nr:FAD binding domain-containing protein [Acidimicrobiia bacterium]
MLRLPPLAHAAPDNIGEVVELLTQDGAMLAAGGTDLVPNLKRRQYPEASLIVSLYRVAGMSGVTVGDDGSVRIGALTTLANLAEDDRVPTAVQEAAGVVATPQIRNRGTVGGNLCVDTRCHWLNIPETWRQAAQPCLKTGGEMCWVAPAKKICWAVTSTDLAPVMIALDATVRLVGPDGEREVPVAALYRNDGMDHLVKGPNEVLIEVVVPPLGHLKTGYRKLRRRGSIDFPILGVAAAVRVEDDRCVDARIVLGAVSSAPVRVTDAEERLVAEPLTLELLTEVGELAGSAVKPMSNIDLTSRYRKRMVPVYVRRLLVELTS